MPFPYAVHEAGHAGAEWLFGCLPHAVHIHILAPGQESTDRRGRTSREAGGFVEGGLPYHVAGQPTCIRLADQPECLIEARRYGLAARFAGPIAQAAEPGKAAAEKALHDDSNLLTEGGARSCSPSSSSAAAV
jgi:hypothetical protein